jgi:hypothetical protein
MLRLQEWPYREMLSRNETQADPTCCDIRPARTLLTLNWQFVDDFGGLRLSHHVPQRPQEGRWKSLRRPRASAR